MKYLYAVRRVNLYRQVSDGTPYSNVRLVMRIDMLGHAATDSGSKKRPNILIVSTHWYTCQTLVQYCQTLSDTASHIGLYSWMFFILLHFFVGITMSSGFNHNLLELKIILYTEFCWVLVYLIPCRLLSTGNFVFCSLLACCRCGSLMVVWLTGTLC